MLGGIERGKEVPGLGTEESAGRWEKEGARGGHL